MKTINKTLIAIAAFTALNANAKIALDADDNTSFDIGGEITSECKIDNTSSNDALDLNLASSEAQSVASVEIWCNTGQSTASTTYSSLNNGKLKNGTNSGQDISYLLDIADTANGTGLDLSTARTVSQASGIGTSGESESKSISIRPQVSGYEYAGTYSDTISVTVSYN